MSPEDQVRDTAQHVSQPKTPAGEESPLVRDQTGRTPARPDGHVQTTPTDAKPEPAAAVERAGYDQCYDDFARLRRHITDTLGWHVGEDEPTIDAAIRVLDGLAWDLKAARETAEHSGPTEASGIVVNDPPGHNPTAAEDAAHTGLEQGGSVTHAGSTTTTSTAQGLTGDGAPGELRAPDEQPTEGGGVVTQPAVEEAADAATAEQTGPTPGAETPPAEGTPAGDATAAETTGDAQNHEGI